MMIASSIQKRYVNIYVLGYSTDRWKFNLNKHSPSVDTPTLTSIFGNEDVMHHLTHQTTITLEPSLSQ